jgi:hypothetical protein
LLFRLRDEWFLFNLPVAASDHFKMSRGSVQTTSFPGQIALILPKRCQLMLRLVAFLLAMILLSGCGGDGNVAEVSGLVTLNGKPTADIAVTFQPLPSDGKNVVGPSAMGVTGADGRYTLKLFGTETRGATVGKNQVKIVGYAAPADMSEEALAKAKPKVIVPSRYYNDPNLMFDVPAKGTKEANFELKSP